MFRVYYVEVNEVKSITVDATYYEIDPRNNLVFRDSSPIPVMTIVAGRWILVERVDA